MTAHQDIPEASDARSFDNIDDAAAALSNLLGDDLEQDDDAPEQGDETDEIDADEAPEGDEGEEQDGSDEPDEPAIDPPVSLNAEAKAVFAQLPPEAQRVWAATEATRNAQVQEVTTKAANAQREAQAHAARATAEAQKHFAQQLMQVASAYAPQPPSEDLIEQNPTAYLQAKARYEARLAQHNQFVQQVVSIDGQASEALQAQERQWAEQEQRKLAATLPEWNDPAQREALVASLTQIGAELGYSPELMHQAGADDILALKKASEWKAKAAKYDAIQARKMQGVRAAKTAKPGTAQAKGAAKARTEQEARSRLRQSGDIKDAVAALQARF